MMDLFKSMSRLMSGHAEIAVDDHEPSAADVTEESEMQLLEHMNSESRSDESEEGPSQESSFKSCDEDEVSIATAPAKAFAEAADEDYNSDSEDVSVDCGLRAASDDDEKNYLTKSCFLADHDLYRWCLDDDEEEEWEEEEEEETPTLGDLDAFDPYETLQIPKKSCNLARVQSQFHRLAPRYCHDTEETEYFQRLVLSFLLLKNTALREIYNESSTGKRLVKNQVNKVGNGLLDDCTDSEDESFVGNIQVASPTAMFRELTFVDGMRAVKESEAFTEDSIFDREAWQAFDDFFAGKSEDDRDYLLMNSSETFSDDEDENPNLMPVGGYKTGHAPGKNVAKPWSRVARQVGISPEDDAAESPASCTTADGDVDMDDAEDAEEEVDEDAEEEVDEDAEEEVDEDEEEDELALAEALAPIPDSSQRAEDAEKREEELKKLDQEYAAQIESALKKSAKPASIAALIPELKRTGIAVDASALKEAQEKQRLEAEAEKVKREKDLEEQTKALAAKVREEKREFWEARRQQQQNQQFRGKVVTDKSPIKASSDSDDSDSDDSDDCSPAAKKRKLDLKAALNDESDDDGLPKMPTLNSSADALHPPKSKDPFKMPSGCKVPQDASAAELELEKNESDEKLKVRSPVSDDALLKWGKRPTEAALFKFGKRPLQSALEKFGNDEKDVACELRSPAKKRGRPKKTGVAEASPASAEKKDVADEKKNTAVAAPKKRGRPRKNPEAAPPDENSAEPASKKSSAKKSSAKKSSGKNAASSSSSAVPEEDKKNEAASAAVTPMKKTRGPAKNKPTKVDKLIAKVDEELAKAHKPVEKTGPRPDRRKRLAENIANIPELKRRKSEPTEVEEKQE